MPEQDASGEPERLPEAAEDAALERLAASHAKANNNDPGCMCGASIRYGSGIFVVCDSSFAAMHGCPYGGVYEANPEAPQKGEDGGRDV